VFDVGFRADGKALAFRSDRRKIVLADLAVNGKLTEIDVPLDVAGGNPDRPARSSTVLWSPVESLLAIASVSATGKGTILLWDAALGQERSRWEGDFDPDNILLAFSPDGKRLACGGIDGTIRCYQLDDRREILRIEGAHHDGVYCLRWEGTDSLLSAGMLNTFRAWTFSTASLRSSVAVDAEQLGLLVYSSDGR
jgi:WD40 repeat protein